MGKPHILRFREKKGVVSLKDIAGHGGEDFPRTKETKGILGHKGPTVFLPPFSAESNEETPRPPIVSQ